MRSLIYTVSISLAFVAGCVAGSSPLVVPQAEAGHEVVEQRWRYECLDVVDANNLKAKADGLGKLGWEMVTGVPMGDGRSVWCFRQPQP
jgi:hypothetical protein